MCNLCVDLQAIMAPAILIEKKSSTRWVNALPTADLTDTEVILQGYKTYGEKIASMLRGMFAFVIYDKETHNLFGARDYFGIKPFYYGTAQDGNLVFSSEIKSILEYPDSPSWLTHISIKRSTKMPSRCT